MSVGFMLFLIHFMGDKEIEVDRFIRNCDCAELFGRTHAQALKKWQLRNVEAPRQNGGSALKKKRLG